MSQLKTIQNTITVNTNKEKVWDLLFNRFGEVSLFNPLIDGSHYTKGSKCEVGTERRCDIDSKTYVHEKITSTRGNNGFDIDIIEGGLPMMGEMKASIDLEVLNNELTKVIFTINFSTKPTFMAGIMKGMIRKMFGKLLIGLKYHLETGQLVTKKNIFSIIREYNRLRSTESFHVAVAA